MSLAAPEVVWTTSQVARHLGISKVHTIRLAKAGKLDFRVTPLGRLYDPQSVVQLAAERER